MTESGISESQDELPETWGNLLTSPRALFALRKLGMVEILFLKYVL